MKRYDLRFLALAILLLVAGVAMGIYMAAAKDYLLMSAHAHVNLVGWTSLALYGLIYRAYPSLAAHRLAPLQFHLAAPAAVLMGPGVALAKLYQIEILAVTAALMWLGGALLLVVQFAGLYREASGDRSFYG